MGSGTGTGTGNTGGGQGHGIAGMIPGTQANKVSNRKLCKLPSGDQQLPPAES